MSDEQAGPPTEAEREQRDMEYVRIAQLRFLEGYRARVAELHPFRKNPRGEALANREQRWSFVKEAPARCPEHLPAHERERFLAGYLHADSLGAEKGIAAMERGDPSKPPPRPKRVTLAVQEDGLLDLAPPMEKREAREWWDHHRGKSFGHVYHDAGEQA